MAKKNNDPAFLFYTSDFLVGVTFMTNEQVGKYIKLLCMQHQTGHLTKEQMVSICGGNDDIIFCKFSVDKKGLFFNKRLEFEIEKRTKYTENRLKNLGSKGFKKGSHKVSHKGSHKGTQVEVHTENENENENTNENRDENKGKKPPKKEYAEKVTLTKKQYEDAVLKYGEEKTKGMIEILSNYKCSKGKKYKSDYHTFASWVSERYDDNTTKQKQSPDSAYRRLKNLYEETDDDEERNTTITNDT